MEQGTGTCSTADGRASVALYAKDGKIWLNQQQMAELFATSKPNISMHIANILKDKELYADSVVKEFLTTAADGKNYNVVFYSLEWNRGLVQEKGENLWNSQRFVVYLPQNKNANEREQTISKD